MIADRSTGKNRSADWMDFVHTGPGSLAGCYMRMFWQPVYRAEDLAPGRAVPIRVMNEDFTLYRGEGGTPHLLAFRCAHRGTQLSTGWVEGDDLRCFYHGWKYNPLGQCIEQPAEPEPFCQRIRIRSYPAVEYLGLIFAYLGEGEPSPLPRYPDFEGEGVVEVETNRMSCNFFNSIENDPVHAAFVHRTSGLPRGVFYIPEVSVEESEWGMTQYRRWPDGEFRISQKGMPNVQHNRRKPKVIPDDPSMPWADDLWWEVPLDDEHLVRFGVMLVPFTGEAAIRYREQRAAWYADVAQVAASKLGDEVLAGRARVQDFERDTRTNVVNLQDYVAQVGQAAIPDRSAERLGRTDVGVVLLRKIWMRELRALAEGRPLKQWSRPERLTATNSRYANDPTKGVNTGGA